MFIALISFMAVVIAFSLVLTITTMDSRNNSSEIIVFMDKAVEVSAGQR